jgi:hypothetical protein
MKTLRSLFIAATAALILAACGSATEVGNPTGEVPTRTVGGAIDLSTISADESLYDAIPSGEVSAQDLSVVASALPEDLRESPVAADGNFTIDVDVGTTYEWDVRFQGVKLGDFSFAQEDGIERTNRLRIRERGDPIEMGRVRFENGVFVPENDPAEGQGSGGNGQGGGGG